MDMIERAAKAIYESRNGARCKPWSIQTKAHKEPYFADAFAAIKAMYEPTDAMASNPMATCYNYGPYGDSDTAT